MSSRYQFSNLVIDRLVKDTPWTRDIPFSVLKAAMPENVTPATESDRGRGAPVFDLWNKDTYQLLSLKVAREERSPRNCVLTTGKAEHIAGVLDAVNAGLAIPTLVIHWNPEGRAWYQLDFDAGAILRMCPPEEPGQGRGHPVTYSNSWRPSGGERILYRGIRLNFLPLGLKFREVRFPQLPAVKLIG